jgi:hypothetical protein
MKQPRALICLICACVWAALMAGLLLPEAAVARGIEAQVGAYRKVSITSWVEEWDPAAQRWVRLEEGASAPAEPHEPGFLVAAAQNNRSATFGFARPAAQPFGAPQFLAQYGPFRVLDDRRAALVGSTDIASPRQFDAMMRDFPGLAVLELVEAPGTSHDLANLALGRKIRAAGLDTHVPTGGSVRSGAVELFLAGKRHMIAPGASFAVHSWMDSRGMEPRHFAEDAPENRLYLDYYEEMGMEADHARAFYAMTNSVPHADALWLDAATMERWVKPMMTPAPPPAPIAPVTLASAALPDAPSDRAGAAELAPMWGSFSMVAQSAHDAIALLQLRVAAPVLPYADVGAVSLARLDSRMVFP